MDRPKPPSQRDVAAAAGVSNATVSLAFRQHPSIPAATRDRVLQAAAELGYRPNPLVSALMRQQRAAREPERGTTTLALITRWPRPSPWKYRWVLPELHEGLCRRAEERGFRLEEFWARSPGISMSRLSGILIARGIEGVIIGPLPVSHGHLRLAWDRFAAVAIGYSLARPVLHRVISHHIHAIQAAMQNLRKAGLKRIGLAMSAWENARVDEQWHAGFLVDQIKCAPSMRVPTLLAPEGSWTSDTLLKWFRRHKPQAILTANAQDVLPWLANAKVRVPEDVEVVNLYWTPHSEPTPGTDPKPFEIGARAVDLVVENLNLNRRGIPPVPETVLIEPEWRERSQIRS